jgi:hypothetical protein
MTRLGWRVLSSRSTPPVRRALRSTAAAALVAAIAVTAPGSASADQQSSVQARIGALESQLSAAGRQVHDLTDAYAAAETDAAALTQQLAVDEARVQEAQSHFQQMSAVLREQLVEAYTGGFAEPSATGSAPASAGSIGGDVNDPAVRYGYVSIVASGVKDSVDGYRTARMQLQTALTAVTSEQRSAQAAATAAGVARQAALDDAERVTSRLAGLQAQLVSLEQAASAARAATLASAPRPVQGGPVNGGLASVVRTQVAPPVVTLPPPTTVAPAPTTSVTLPRVTVTVPPALVAPPVVAPPTTAPPTTVAAPTVTQTGGSTDVWLELRQCESGDDYQANTGNGYYGAYQFSQQTWTALGYPGRPDLEPPAMQDQAAHQLQAQSGWGQWPACAAALGLT